MKLYRNILQEKERKKLLKFCKTKLEDFGVSFKKKPNEGRYVRFYMYDNIPFSCKQLLIHSLIINMIF